MATCTKISITSNDYNCVYHQSYSVEEVMAEAICVARAGDLGLVDGWVYAVERLCTSASMETCTGICTSRYLHVQDSQSVHHTWRAFSALHIYGGRPNTSPSTRSDPHIGLKVYYYRNVDEISCGPNFCCCFAN